MNTHLPPSVWTSHTYLTMFGVLDCHLLQIPTQVNSLQHWHRVHLVHSDLPQTLHAWKGRNYSISISISISNSILGQQEMQTMLMEQVHQGTLFLMQSLFHPNTTESNQTNQYVMINSASN